MKNLLILITIMLVGGCNKTPTLEESVVGEYEAEVDGQKRKDVYLENGVREWYVNGRRSFTTKWSIVDGEIHVNYNNGWEEVYRINKDNSITWIAKIVDGKRDVVPKEWLHTYKKIK